MHRHVRMRNVLRESVKEVVPQESATMLQSDDCRWILSRAIEHVEELKCAGAIERGLPCVAAAGCALGGGSGDDGRRHRPPHCDDRFRSIRHFRRRLHPHTPWHCVLHHRNPRLESHFHPELESSPFRCHVAAQDRGVHLECD